MTTDQLQLFGGDWTEKKLAILQSYLQAYSKVLKNQPFNRVYIDAFAGTGYRERPRGNLYDGVFTDFQQPDAQAFLKGSAKLALEIDPPFDRYIFVETDARKVEELERLEDQHPDRAGSITIKRGDANEEVRQYCRSMTANERAVVFLDPFATQVEWQTIEAIARTCAIDVWILFPLMAVNRLLASDPHKACREALNRVFGTADWFERFYRTRIEGDIFGRSIEVVQRACDIDSIGAFYLDRLRGIFVGTARQPGMLKNSRGAPLFQLFFCVGNKNGAPPALRIAENLLKRI